MSKLRATHQGILLIGERGIPCAVLSDGRRVLSARGATAVLGGKRGGSHWARLKKGTGANLPPFLSANNLKPFIPKTLQLAPTPYITLDGQHALGVDAELLPQMCEVFMLARDEGVLTHNQKPIAKAAEILMRGLAHVGILALVDEATGYQDSRARDALAKILEAFVAKEIRKWVKTFPADFYRELFRLKGIPFPATSIKKPRYVGKLTNDLVYRRIAPGVLDKLQEVNPKTPSGRRKAKHHQWMTEDLGHPKLREHLAAVITVMQLSATWDDFIPKLNRVKPVQKELPLLDGLEP